MRITEAETWLCRRDRNYFDSSRTGRSPMPWDVVVLRLATDTGLSSVVSFLGARSGLVTEAFLHENILPVVLGRDPHDREAIWHEYWNMDRHLCFFPVYLPGPIDAALWELAALEASLPLHRYIGSYRTSLPVYASGLFHEAADEYVAEAKRYAADGIRAYKGHPCGPWRKDMEIHAALRNGVGPDVALFSDPVGEYSLDEAIRVGFTVTKKIGNAVVRNRMKRRFRALARELMPVEGIGGADHVLIGRQSGVERPYATLRDELAKALAKARRR